MHLWAVKYGSKGRIDCRIAGQEALLHWACIMSRVCPFQMNIWFAVGPPTVRVMIHIGAINQKIQLLPGVRTHSDWKSMSVRAEKRFCWKQPLGPQLELQPLSQVVGASSPHPAALSRPIQACQAIQEGAASKA
eukprot:1161452-Pelagomonas_calceolata.AAC.1